MSKLIAFLTKIFPAKKPIQTVQPTTVPTLGSPIRSDETDYRPMFGGW